MLEKIIIEKHGLNKKQSRTIIRDLIFSGELTYTYEFGSTFLERSFARPVRISKHVVLTPPDRHYREDPDDIVVRIKPGVSFGAGRHPTTRLAIKAIDFALHDHRETIMRPKGRVLDVGTGSGVLILAAVLGGMHGGRGIDVDPCARMEAAENVRINGLEDKIEISAAGIEAQSETCSMVLANLRYPGLIRISARLADTVDRHGLLVFSGLKNNEVNDLLTVYAEKKFDCLWTLDELGWTGVVLQKKRGNHHK